MKIIQINATCGIGSTGKICIAISEMLKKNGLDSKIYYTLYDTDYSYGIKYSTTLYQKIQALKSRILGNSGFNSKLSALYLVKCLKKDKPDIIHLHNIHSHDFNLKIVFKYLKKTNIKLIWTFHDCWAFTGNCTHFTFAKCEKWKNQCMKCPQIGLTSWIFDRSSRMYGKKKELFSDLNLAIVTPSMWLADLVKQSFLRDYPIHVINNGIDLNIFKPRKSDIRKKLGISDDEYMILGVSFGWSKYKGLDVFINLARSLPVHFRVVLVGTDKNIDKKLPKDIISIHRTNNQIEMAELYTAADVFVNATREENFPTVHLEALACGTPVISFDTGGCREMLNDSCGVVVPTDDEEALRNSIMDACYNHTFSSESCIEQSKKFDKEKSFEKYMDLYKNIDH